MNGAQGREGSKLVLSISRLVIGRPRVEVQVETLNFTSLKTADQFSFSLGHLKIS